MTDVTVANRRADSSANEDLTELARHGDRHDLRAIIHDLHCQTNVIDADKSASA